MGFLNPLLLAGAAVLALPILIHLVRNDQSQRVQFSSLMFLLRIPKKTVRQQRLKNLLLMALRLLLIALLVAAFARPYLVRSTAAVPAIATEDSLVLMLDTSYSMDYGTNFERMRAEARSRLDALAPGARAGLVVFNATATAPAQVSDDVEQMQALIDALEPSTNRTNFYEAFTVADRLLAQLEGTNRRLVIVSDFQRNGWDRPARESVIDSNVEVEFVDLGVENPDNTGIDAVGVDGISFAREYAGQLSARVHNHRLVEPATVTVALEIEGRRVEGREVTIPSESSVLVEFTGFELPMGFAEGRVLIENEDALGADNERWFVIERRERMNLLILDAGTRDQSRFLQTAYSAYEEFPFTVERMRYDAATPARVAQADVVIVNDVPRLSDGIAAALGEARSEGQGQLVILAANAETAWWNGFEGLPVRIVEKVFVNRDRGQPFYSLTRWDRGHDMFTRIEVGGQRLSLNSVQFYAYSQMEPAEGALVVASMEDGSPMIVQTPSSEGGRLMVVGSAVDSSAWNDWWFKRDAFVGVTHGAAYYLSGYTESPPYYELGQSVPVPDAGDLGAAVVTPDDERVTLGEPGSQTPRFFSPEMAGIHELRIGPEIFPVAVNGPSSESVLESMPPEDLLSSVRRREGEVRTGALVAGAGEADYAERQNWWWYLFLFALLVGIGEIYLGNRVTKSAQERRPLPDAP